MLRSTCFLARIARSYTHSPSLGVKDCSPRCRLSSWSRRAAEPAPATRSRWHNLAKATVFTISGSALCFASAVVWEYERMRQRMSSPVAWPWQSLFQPHQKQGEWRQQLHLWWQRQTEGQRLFWPICLANSLVFLAWRVPGLQPTLVRYFISSASSSSTVLMPMLLSSFSHASFLHLACNMFVLHSFSTEAVKVLGTEQFAALYVSGALTASLLSYLVRSVTAATAGSLGASGAIMTVLAFVCVNSPDLRMSLIFLPMYSFTAGTAVKALLAFDTLGVALGWQLFDHAAHLGGALLGIYWGLRGRDDIWEKRAPVIKWYHDLRESLKKK